MVKTFGEMDSDIVDVLKQGQMQSQVLKQGKMQSDVLKQRQMQSDKLTRQFNILNPSYLSQSQCSLKEGISTNSSRDGNQIDQLDTSNFSSLPLGKHSDEEEICMNCERDDQRAHKRNTSILCCLPKRYMILRRSWPFLGAVIQMKKEFLVFTKGKR